MAIPPSKTKQYKKKLFNKYFNFSGATIFNALTILRSVDISWVYH